MKEFIKVTSNGKKVLINVASIVAVTEDNNGCAVIHFSVPKLETDTKTFISDNSFGVRQSCQKVIGMMGVDLSEE